ASFVAGWGPAAAFFSRMVPWRGRARAAAWAAAIGVILAAVLASSGIAAADARAFLASDASLLASGDQIPIVAGSAPSILFGGPVPIDRSIGRYLHLGFTIFRQGPDRDAPDDGLLH